MTIALARHDLSARLSRFRRRLARDERGVAAVEFAMLLPLMLTLYLGCAEISQGVGASRGVALASRTLSDLAAQQASGTALTDAQLTDLWAAAQAVMAPYQTTTLKMTLSSVEFVPNGATFNATTKWSVSNNGSLLRPCQVLASAANSAAPTRTTMPAGLYAAGTVLVADVSYTYTQGFSHVLFGWANSSILNMGRTSYMRPRVQYAVSYTAGTGTVCP